MLSLFRIVPHVPAHPSYYLLKPITVTAVADLVFYFKNPDCFAMSVQVHQNLPPGGILFSHVTLFHSLEFLNSVPPSGMEFRRVLVCGEAGMWQEHKWQGFPPSFLSKQSVNFHWRVLQSLGSALWLICNSLGSLF